MRAVLVLRPPLPGDPGLVARAARMNASDRAFLGREYNNRELVPDHPKYFARWDEASARVRRTMTCRLDQRYGDMPGETIDLFPARKGDGSCMMFIHGGYWRALDKKDFSFLAPPWVDAGVSLAVVNYDLCPKVTIDEIVRQMLRASRWLFLRAEQYGMDQDRLYVAGHSAGGHLVATAAERALRVLSPACTSGARAPGRLDGEAGVGERVGLGGGIANLLSKK